MRISSKSYIYIFIIVLLVFFSRETIRSQFLIDEDIVENEKVEKEEKNEKEVKKKEDEIPKHIARNIKAELVPDIKGAIRITWNVHKDSDDDYIIGRAIEVPDKMEKALKAVSIKVVPAGARTVVIDSNLTPGDYYYCIISKKRILDREIELIPNMNYTTSPVIIEKEHYQPFIRGLPQQVSLIYAREMNKSRILITWRGVESGNVVYTVYRGNSQLDNPEKLKRTGSIAIITDGRESFVDKSITQSGTYYYAVTTKDIQGNEDLSLIPDQSYTASGIYINVGSLGTVANIKSFPIDESSVKVTWTKTGSGISEYLIYSYSRPVSDANRLALSVFLDSIQKEENSYIDKSTGYGNRYYAVLAKMENGKVNSRLVREANYTVTPIAIGKPIRIRSIAANMKGEDVELTWKFIGSTGNRNYRILRSMDRIKSSEDIEGAYIVDYVNIFDQGCIDKNPPFGNYYYAVVPENIDTLKNYRLIDGVNVTRDPIEILKGETTPRVAIKKRKPRKRLRPKRQPVQPEMEFIPRKIEKIHSYDVDMIINGYFFKGSYRIAIKELEDLVKSTDNKYERAKAKLFIARSLVELRRYRKALNYLILPDVTDNFPRESRFWRQFALSKLE